MQLWCFLKHTCLMLWLQMDGMTGETPLETSLWLLALLLILLFFFLVSPKFYSSLLFFVVVVFSNYEVVYLNAGQCCLGSTIAWDRVQIIRIGPRMQGNSMNLRQPPSWTFPTLMEISGFYILHPSIFMMTTISTMIN